MSESYTVDGTPEVSSEKAKLCSKCGLRPRRKDHEWCDECKREKQAQYVRDRDEMCRSQGFAAGAEAMRRALLDSMKLAHPLGTLNVIEISRWIAGTPAPKSLSMEATGAKSPSLSST
jgi:hypothetical protein